MTDLAYAIYIDSPVQRLKEAVSTTEGWTAWWAQTDDDYTIHFDKNKVMAKFKKTAETEFECIGGDIKEWLGTRLLFKLEERNGKTFLTFAHANWKAQTEYCLQCSVQWGYLLKASLQPYVEQGAGNPME